MAEMAQLSVIDDEDQLTSSEEILLTAVEKERSKAVAVEKAHLNRKLTEATKKMKRLEKRKRELEIILEQHKQLLLDCDNK